MKKPEILITLIITFIFIIYCYLSGFSVFIEYLIKFTLIKMDFYPYEYTSIFIILKVYLHFIIFWVDYLPYTQKIIHINDSFISNLPLIHLSFYSLSTLVNCWCLFLNNSFINIIYFIDYIENYIIVDNFIIIKNILINLKFCCINYIMIWYKLLNYIVYQLDLYKSITEFYIKDLFLKSKLTFFLSILYTFYYWMYFDINTLLLVIQYKLLFLCLEYYHIVWVYISLYLTHIVELLELFISQLPLSSNNYYINNFNNTILEPFITLIIKIYLYLDEYLSYLFRNKIFISYIFIKISFKIKLLIKLIIKAIMNIMWINIFHNKIINYLFKSCSFIFTFNYNNNNNINNNNNYNNNNFNINNFNKHFLLKNTYLNKLSTITLSFIPNYYKLKYIILSILGYFSIWLFLSTYFWPFILTVFYNIGWNLNLYLNLQYYILQIILPISKLGLKLEEVYLCIKIIIFFIFIWISIKKKWHHHTLIKPILSVIPLSLSDEEIYNNITESESNETQFWNDPQMNFKNITVHNKNKYISTMMESKGLDINPFLINYFIGAILNNTSGNKMDVDNFLNTNLNTIMNDQRNLQLNKHSYVRFKPFLLNNSTTSYYSSVLPYIPDDAFAYELKEELEAMKEAQITARNEVNNNNELTETSKTLIEK